MDAKPFVSIIIPFKNEEKYLGACLAGIAALDWPRDRVEVIALDNGSTDASESIARSFGIQYVTAPGRRSRANRNRGAREGRGEILAFVDADCVVPPDWLSVAADLFASDPAIGNRRQLLQDPPRVQLGRPTSGTSWPTAATPRATPTRRAGSPPAT